MDKKVDHKHILLVDGYNFIFRAYHALPALTHYNGTAVGAVYGFISMMLKLLAEYQDHHVAVIFDSGVKSFRNDIYPAYKANRPPVPEDLRYQFKVIREATAALNLPIIEKAGYEADDIIASFVALARNTQEKVIIVSSDKDLMQLIGHNIFMLDPIKSRFITEDIVKEKYGVTKDKLLDIFALMGDSSDNIPGVKGIGPKTAAELINKYNDIEQLYLNIPQITPERRRNLLIENKELAFLSKTLLKLDEQVELPLSLAELKIKNIDYNKLFSFLETYGFKSLITRAEQVFKHQYQPAVPVQNIINITNPEQIQKLYQTAYQQGCITFYAFTNAKTNSIEKIEFYLKNQTYSISLLSDTKQELQTSLLEQNSSPKSSLFTLSNTLKLLLPLFTDPYILKIGYDIKSFMVRCAFELKNNSNECNISPIEDIMLLSYLVNNGLCTHDIESIAKLYQEDGNNLYQTELMTKLYTLLLARLNEDHLNTLYRTIEKPLIYAIATMEKVGVSIDISRLKTLSKEFTSKLEVLEQKIYEEAGCSFNIGSPKQLSEILFDKLSLNKGKKSGKALHYKTDVVVLEELYEQGHNIAGLVLEWRQLAKLQNTYTDALPKQINPVTSRIHTHYAMAGTSTGRLSSSNPNLQNIPIRSEEGQKIRESFIARPGYKLLSADYSQIELRLLAHLASISTLKQAFFDNKDIHSITASQIFKIPLTEIDANLRRKAKAINFGIIYGITGFGLAKRLDISVAEANKYIELYFKEYPGIELYMNNTKEFARKNGYVETLFGRKCYVTTINNANANIRSFAERAAINAPLQGTAADIIKKAMVKINNILQAKKLLTTMNIQVHDELIFEIPESELDITPPLIKNIMENIITLDVPLTVDMDIGNNWSVIH